MRMGLKESDFFESVAVGEARQGVIRTAKN